MRSFSIPSRFQGDSQGTIRESSCDGFSTNQIGMRSNLDEKRFKETVIGLAAHFQGGPALAEEVIDKVAHRKR